MTTSRIEQPIGGMTGIPLDLWRRFLRDGLLAKGVASDDHRGLPALAGLRIDCSRCLCRLHRRSVTLGDLYILPSDRRYVLAPPDQHGLIALCVFSARPFRPCLSSPGSTDYTQLTAAAGFPLSSTSFRRYVKTENSWIRPCGSSAINFCTTLNWQRRFRECFCPANPFHQGTRDHGHERPARGVSGDTTTTYHR